MEHPFFGSWGYQITGYFAPSSRFGSPEDFAFLVDELHKAGIGVFLDWVPSHFPNDAHGLYRFDGTALYEHEDPRLGYHPDWKSYIFNYGRNEVRSFLISNAIYWLDRFHIDGIRVDAVASMLYLDYSRKEGEWIPNRFGGRENLDAISFLREMNEAIYKEFPDVQSIAEESTSWPMVSRPVSVGGLGFGMKWMMGWMNDVLVYMKENPIYRRFHQNKLTFSLVYAFSENFMLPLSHDEVVHGKGSILSRMPGDEWQRFANIRALYAWMYTHPGAKLLFMGNEFAQFSEWKHDESLLWNLYGFDYHSGVAEMVKELNELYRKNKALYELNFSGEGFEWVDYGDTKNSIVCFYRKSKGGEKKVLVLGNFTPVAHDRYRIGVDETGKFKEIFNSDSMRFGGSDFVNLSPIKVTDEPSHGRAHSIELRIPPLGFVVLEPSTSK
jgi:1,4-alpha-glucan branching enzyme